MTVIDIIRNIVESLTFVEDIDNIVDNSDGTYDILLCRTRHQSANNLKVTLDGKQYRIIGVVVDEKIVIQELDPLGAPSITTWTIEAPKFFHGTAIKVSEEMLHIDGLDKFPMVYLLGGFNETVEGQNNSALDRTSDVIYYCLDQIKKEWKTETHYDNIIKPMIELEKEIREEFVKSPFIAKFDSYTRRDWVEFGIAVTNEGNKQLILNELASGVENRISLPLLRGACKNC